MKRDLTVVFDCNIYITAALAVGPGGGLDGLGRAKDGLCYPDRQRAEALLWAMRGRAGEIVFHVGWSDHIWKTVRHVLYSYHGWSLDATVDFTDGIQMRLIDATDGHVIDPVGEGFVRMDDHEDSAVYETARLLANQPPAILVTDDVGFLHKANEAGSTVRAVNSRAFCNMCQVACARRR